MYSLRWIQAVEAPFPGCNQAQLHPLHDSIRSKSHLLARKHAENQTALGRGKARIPNPFQECTHE